MPFGTVLLIGTRQMAAAAAATPASDTIRPTAVVEGRVIRPDGTPINGAVVAVLASGDSTVTGDSGRFVLRNITPGPHMVSVRGVGFQTVRVAVTLSAGQPRALTITLAQTVPILTRIVTTAPYPSGYADVGLDKRMRAGVGEFVTVDQIEARHAVKITDLLQHLRAVHLFSYGMVDIGDSRVTATSGSCVVIILDGVPQKSYTSHDLDNLVGIDEIGAIEVYSPSEVPSMWRGAGTGVNPKTGEEDIKGQPTPSGTTYGLVGSGQTCAVMAIWTRSRLGLGGYPDADSSVVDTAARAMKVRATVGRAPMTTGTALFQAAGASTCVPPSPIDSTTANVYAVLQSSAPSQDTTWINYSNRVFSAFRQAFALPNPVVLPVFGYASPAFTKTSPRPNGLAVGPTLSSVITFTLSPAGALLESAVAASSLSGSADTSILAAVAGAAASHTFPATPMTAPPASVRFDVVLTTTLPDSTQHAVVLDHIALQEWPLTRQAALASGSQPVLVSGRTSAAEPPDSVTFEFVVDETGKPVMATGRAITPVGRVTDPAYLGFVARIARVLPAFRFEPALIGACPVRQITRQLFAD